MNKISCNNVSNSQLMHQDTSRFEYNTTQPQKDTVQQKEACKLSTLPLFLQNNIKFVNDDDDYIQAQRQKSQTTISQWSRERAQTQLLFEKEPFDRMSKKQKQKQRYNEDDDSDEYNYGSDSSSSDSDDSYQNYLKKQSDYVNLNQNYNKSSQLNFQQQDILLDNEYLDNQYNQQYNQHSNYQNSIHYQQPTQKQQQSQYQHNDYNSYNQSDLINLQSDLKDQDNCKKIKKCIQKDKLSKVDKKKLNFRYKKMSKEEYEEFRATRSLKSYENKIKKEKNAGCIETETIQKLVLVKKQKQMKKNSLKQQCNLQESSNSQQEIQTEGSQSTQILKRTQLNESFDIFQFSRNSSSPLIKTIHKKEFVIDFEIKTPNPHALLEIGVFNYHDNIEFYFINKFKIINKFVNRNYNSNKYFETELTTDDFVFRNGTRFQFSVKYNCIILRNLDTQTNIVLYCEKYISTNKKLNIFIRMFNTEDQVILI